MEMNDLRNILKNNFINAKDTGVCVYGLIKDNEIPVKIDIDTNSLSDLRDLFLSRIQDVIVNDNELNLLKLSSADDRNKVIYEYDLEIPNELKTLDYICNNDDISLMNINNVSLTDIRVLIIEIGNDTNQLLLYKTMAPINIYSQSQFFMRKHKSRLEKVNSELLRITSDFQMIRVNGSLIVMDLKTLERNFGFHDVIKKVASEGCNAIEAIKLLENPDVLRELIEDVRYARKLTKIAKSSPVLINKISNENIIKFCEYYPKLKGRIKFNQTKDKIILDTKVSKNLFIQLLMDDLLTSELTKLHYTSLAKDSVDN
ncbi:anti-phage protein KwaB [Pasteurella multocida]